MSPLCRRMVLTVASVTLGVLIGACAATTPAPITPATAPTSAPTASAFVLTSPAFAEGAAIPKKFSCDGENISPALKWNGAPANAKSFALILDDPDAPGGAFTHWVAFDIAASQNEIGEGAPGVGKGGQNGRRQTGYTGPCPPAGTHRYFFTLFALDVAALELNDGATRAEVEKAMTGHVLAKTQWMGRYTR